MPAARPGVDSNPQSPLHRSLDQLITTGKPFSRLALTFLSDRGGQLRWFGAFAEGKRTMFFPGFTTAFDSIDVRRGPEPQLKRSFELDHLSLEQDRKNWHLTTQGSTDHIGSPSTLALGSGRFLWFGLSFGSLEAFLPVYDRTALEFESPSSDAERRRAVIMAARENAEFPILSLPDGPLDARQGSYFHTSVIAGPAGFETYLGAEHAYPIGSPFLSSSMPSRLDDLPCKIFRLKLSVQTELQITVMRLPGKLLVPVTFTGPQQPQTL